MIFVMKRVSKFVLLHLKIDTIFIYRYGVMVTKRMFRRFFMSFRSNLSKIMKTYQIKMAMVN